MQRKLEAQMAASVVTGLSVTLIQEDRIDIICLGEFEGETVTEKTIWPVASLTKPVFAYGLLQQTRIELDRPLETYLSKPYAEIDLSTVTARQAMSHTTGLPNWRGAEGLKVLYLPGERFSYSGEGLNYLQYVVEQVFGVSLDVYLEQFVFSPLGMAHTKLRRETEATLSPPLTFLLHTLPANSAFSLYTTARDYARFVRAMFAPDNIMLVPQAQVGEFDTLYWGLGWGLQGDAFWHWGSRGIPRTMNFVMGWPAQKRAIIICTNHADGLYLCKEIIHDLFPQSPLTAFDWLLPASAWRPDGKAKPNN